MKFLREEIRERLKELNKQRIIYERILKDLKGLKNLNDNVAKPRPSRPMTEATRRKISLAMKRVHAAKKAKT